MANYDLDPGLQLQALVFCQSSHSLLAHYYRCLLDWAAWSAAKNSKVIRRIWSGAAEIIEKILSRYLLGAQIGCSITVTYVHEAWGGQWQHYYKVAVKHLDTKCATRGFAPADVFCRIPLSRLLTAEPA